MYSDLAEDREEVVAVAMFVQICLSLTKYKKDVTNPEVYKQSFLEVTSRHPNYVQIFTDGSKVNEKVAAAAVSSVVPNRKRLLFALHAMLYSQLSIS